MLSNLHKNIYLGSDSSNEKTAQTYKPNINSKYKQACLTFSMGLSALPNKEIFKKNSY